MILQGFYVEDTVCIVAHSDFCVDHFRFFEITSAKGLQFDGILGMSPYRGSKSNSIVRSLAEANIIEEETATFCLNK